MILVLKFMGDVPEAQMRRIADDIHLFIAGMGCRLLVLRDGEDLNTLPPERAKALRDILLKEYPIA